MPDPPLSHELRRSRALRLGVLTSVVSRGAAALTPLLVIPIGLQYLGAHYYGAWATGLALTSLVLFADFGIGTGLMTRLGRLQGDEDSSRSEAKRYIASGYAAVMTLCVILLVGLLASTLVADWSSLLGIEPSSVVVSWIVVITLGAYVLNITSFLIVRIQYGIGEQPRSNMWQLLGSVATLIVTWLAARADPGPVLFVAFASAPIVLVSAVNTITFFTTSASGRALRPRLQDIQPTVAIDLMRLGGRFLVVSVLMSISIALDPWIVARTQEVADVPEYVVPFRLFTFISTLAVMLTVPLWPFHSSAIQSGDVGWIRSITRRMTIATVAVVGGGATALAFAGPMVMSIWIGEDFPVNRTLWWGLAAWIVVQAVASASFMVQNGAEVLGPQTIAYGLLALTIPIKWWVSSTHGLQWIPWVGAASYCVIVWPACRRGYSKSLSLATSMTKG